MEEGYELTNPNEPADMKTKILIYAYGYEPMNLIVGHGRYYSRDLNKDTTSMELNRWHTSLPENESFSYLCTKGTVFIKPVVWHRLLKLRVLPRFVTWDYDERVCNPIYCSDFVAKLNIGLQNLSSGRNFIPGLQNSLVTIIETLVTCNNFQSAMWKALLVKNVW